MYTRSIIPGLLIHLLTNITYVVTSYIRGGDMLGELSTPDGPETWTVIGTGVLSVAAGLAGWRLLRYIRGLVERGPADESKSVPADSLRLGWLIPVLLAAVVFVVKQLWIGGH
ncbi:hypothetical protein [Paenibacillus tarimensis]|uniref:hypothetical protein n=1 Tax=Paenibacillus tarimensis TaxID=416012 RepID=UPI001F45530D|nr:hypothetical protein [Paenibacillus tarimensis]MCF2945791.1 hypothetical protein [Paenibacillus tarimensis]